MSWSRVLFNLGNAMTFGGLGAVSDLVYGPRIPDPPFLDVPQFRPVQPAGQLTQAQLDAGRGGLRPLPPGPAPQFIPIQQVGQITQAQLDDARVGLQNPAIRDAARINQATIDLMQDLINNPREIEMPEGFNITLALRYIYNNRQPRYRITLGVTNNIGTTEYFTVNARTYQSLLGIIEGTAMDAYYERLQHDEFNRAGMITISYLSIEDEGDGARRRIGGFFDKVIRNDVKLPSNVEGKLRDCQIFEIAELYHLTHIEDVTFDNCLISAVNIQMNSKDAGSKIRRYMIGDKVDSWDMGEIADELGVYIHIHRIDKSFKEDKGRPRGTPTKERKELINIALYNNHYFPYWDLVTDEQLKTFNSVTGNKWTKSKYIKDMLDTIIGATGIKRFNKMSTLKLVALMDSYNKFKDMPSEFYKFFGQKQPEEITMLELAHVKEITYQDKQIAKGVDIEDLDIIHADIESAPKGVHIPIAISYVINDDEEVQHIAAIETCLRIFIDTITTVTKDNKKKGAIIYFHNLGYDGTFFQQRFPFINDLSKGSRIYGFTIIRNNQKLIFKDTLAYLPMRLKDMPSSFGIRGIEKEIFPYLLYNPNNVYQDVVLLERARPHIDINKWDTFVDNATNLGFIVKDRYFKHMDYMRHYCNRDVTIQRTCFNIFAEAFKKDFDDIDIHTLWSISSAAQQYVKKNGALAGCLSVGGAAMEFLTKCGHGGRVASLRGEAYHIKNKPIIVMDFTQLYPVSLIINCYLGGLLKGGPKPFRRVEDLPLDVDAFFAEVDVISIPNDYDWPNCVLGIGYYCSMDIWRWQMFEGMEEGIHYNIIRGYYYEDGRNPVMKEVVGKIIRRRTEKKNRRNEAGEKDPDKTNICEKNAANGIVGKFGQKEYTNSKRYVVNEEANLYISKFWHRIDSWTVGDNITIIKEFKRNPKATNEAHIYSEALAISKIMTSLILDECRKKDVKIYYHDTDCFFMSYEDFNSGKIDHLFDLERFASLLCDTLGLDEEVHAEMIELMKETGAGTIHNDIDVKGDDKERHMVLDELIIAGKKLYCGRYGYVEKGEDKTGLKKACKGINWKCVKDKYDDPMEMYRELTSEDREATIDLAANGRPSFERNKEGNIQSRDTFPRTIHCHKTLNILDGDSIVKIPYDDKIDK
jgi:hypothetical protein